MNREHRLKSLPPYFRAVVERRKPFEIRKDDRAYDEGDVLVLCEWEPLDGFTGAEVRAPVTYVMRGGDLGLERGYAILGIAAEETYRPAMKDSPAPTSSESAPPLADEARVPGSVVEEHEVGQLTDDNATRVFTHPCCEAYGCDRPGINVFHFTPLSRGRFCNIHVYVRPESILLEWHGKAKKARAA